MWRCGVHGCKYLLPDDNLIEFRKRQHEIWHSYLGKRNVIRGKCVWKLIEVSELI